MDMPPKCVVDTNVPKTANRAQDPDGIPDELTTCVLNCVEAIEYIVKKGGLVIDSGDEIFTEYRHQLRMEGQPGVGDHFMKWVHDRRWQLPEEDRVTITKNGKTYNEFPDHDDLINFDDSDRKFVAVANAHSQKPSILEATDSTWWGWKDALHSVGIRVVFVCPDYVEQKFREKMG
ncbi:MAG: hypothetical protein K9N55_03215 [Phycisphaerae bacterium]|nr:hypothetical protein [Phycisphaerae bacterium]